MLSKTLKIHWPQRERNQQPAANDVEAGQLAFRTWTPHCPVNCLQQFPRLLPSPKRQAFKLRQIAFQGEFHDALLPYGVADEKWVLNDITRCPRA